MLVKILLFTAFAGHVLCWLCDRLITFTPNGVFSPKDLGDNERLSRTFEGFPLKRAELSMLAGVLALVMILAGDLGLCLWIRESSPACAKIMAAGALVFAVFGSAHHVLCGVVEWLYVRMGRTDEARTAVLEMFKRTALTMVACYVGLLVFAGTLFGAIVSGITPLPRLCCLINTIPFFVLLTLCRVHNAGNLAGAAMFLGLLIAI
ncbi:MAG: hypothetical protein IJ071_00205 [Ruminococcus sp.]|nr:hypothetical protein [Ruminococcus sp.]